MAKGKECYIRVRGTLVAVTPDVYHVCHQTKRQAKTLSEKDERNNLVSYDGMDTEEILGEETIPDLSTPSVEDIVLDRLHKEKLRLCLPMLTKEEWALVYALYYGMEESILSESLLVRFGIVVIPGGHGRTLHEYFPLF